MAPTVSLYELPKGSQLLADQLESIPVQTEAVEPGHTAGTWRAGWSSAPGASLHCMWMRWDSDFSNTSLFASSQRSVTEGLPTGASQAVLTLRLS